MFSALGVLPMNKSIPLEVKASAAGVIEGYASTFGPPPDSYGDIIAAGAFSESLLEHEAAGTKPAMFWAHDQSAPIGKWQEIREDGDGLYVKGKLTLATAKGAEALALAKDDALALSIGFKPIRQKPHEGANLIEAAHLGEISLVGLAANPKARITAVKSLDGIKTVREFEAVMRECHGLSARQAKKLSQGGFEGLIGTTTEQQAHELADMIRKSAARFHTGH